MRGLSIDRMFRVPEGRVGNIGVPHAQADKNQKHRTLPRRLFMSGCHDRWEFTGIPKRSA
jgi:hypothetical protein